MNDVKSYLTNAELALAAYAELRTGLDNNEYIDSLMRGGMSLAQAKLFSSDWRVVDQYDGRTEETYVDEFGQKHTYLNSTGLSVTVFENIADGKRYLAIRGTQPSDINDLLTDAINIVTLGTTKYQSQYDALSKQVKQWLADGVLQSGFSVAGHSLGGFLATGVATEFSADVAHTYLYDSPGVTGLSSGDLLEAIVNALMPGRVTSAIPLNLSISNITAVGDFVSQVGSYVAPPIEVTVNPQSPFGAHNMAALTDALAVYDWFSRIQNDIEFCLADEIVRSVY